MGIIVQRGQQQRLFTTDDIDTEKYPEVTSFLRRWNTCSVGKHDWKERKFSRRCRVCGTKQIMTIKPNDYDRNFKWRVPDRPNERGGWSSPR